MSPHAARSTRPNPGNFESPPTLIRVPDVAGCQFLLRMCAFVQAPSMDHTPGMASAGIPSLPRLTVSTAMPVALVRSFWSAILGKNRLPSAQCPAPPPPIQEERKGSPGVRVESRSALNFVAI